MNTFIAKIKQGLEVLDFGSAYNRARYYAWCKDNIGKEVRIKETESKVSDDLRNYYFGAVIPVIRSTCDEWKDLKSEEIHEIIKKMLFYFETYNPLTKRIERFGRSVMKNDDWNSTTKAMEFLEIIRQYLADCGLEMPSAEEYVAFKNSAPTI